MPLRIREFFLTIDDTACCEALLGPRHAFCFSARRQSTIEKIND